MSTNGTDAPIIANCDAKSPKASKCEEHEEMNRYSPAPAAVVTHLAKLQLNFIQREHAIRMKAIADREAAELSLARKEYRIRRSILVGNEINADGVEDENNSDAIIADADAESDLEHASPPTFFDYVSSTQYSLSMAPRGSPTPQQVCARQVMSADLPTFSGDPEAWPVFYSQYKNTTKACGFSNSENLVRLQRCLTGQALEYVRSRLLLPNLVPKVMETLKMLYGRPTVIIDSLINKVRAIPPPEMDRLESIINYGIAIQNLVDHLIAMEQTAHLCNPTLLQELIAKLPGEMKLQWARYKRQNESASLSVLCEFMNELVQAACEVTNTGSEAHSNEAYSGSESFGNSQCVSNSNSRICFVCKSQNHRVEGCDEFNSLEISRRWRLIGDLKLCRSCLNRRHAAGVCPNAYECGTEGCRLLHHPLLHQSRTQ